MPGTAVDMREYASHGRSLLQGWCYVEFTAERAQAFHYARVQRDAVAQALLLRLELGLAGHEDAVDSRRAGRLVQRVDVGVHRALELVDRAEGGRVDGRDHV